MFRLYVVSRLTVTDHNLRSSIHHFLALRSIPRAPVLKCETSQTPNPRHKNPKPAERLYRAPVERKSFGRFFANSLMGREIERVRVSGPELD